MLGPLAPGRLSNEEKRGPFFCGNELPCTTSAVPSLVRLRVSSARGPARARIIASVTLYPPRVRHRPTSFPGQKVGRACNARCSTRRSRRVHNLRNDGRCTEVEVEREREDEKGKAKNFACTRCLTFTLFVRFMGED